MSYEFSPAQRTWIDALKSGGYNQTQGSLEKDGAFCCLGVASYLLASHLRHEMEDNTVTYDDNTAHAPREVVAELGLLSSVGHVDMLKASNAPEEVHHATTLAAMNDDGSTFAEIAEFIETNPKAVFRASVEENK